MARCDHCKSTILFGGKKVGGLTFCNDTCMRKGASLILSRELPQDVVNKEVFRVHQGLCPKCKGMGPVDVHPSHEVWSVVFMTRWKTIPNICCRSCGRKKQMAATLFSAIAGWWGFPWGLLVTPLQIFHNIRGMAGGPDPQKPSPQLESLVRQLLAAQVIQSRQAPDGTLPPGATRAPGR